MADGASMSNVRQARGRLRLAAMTLPIALLATFIGQTAAGPVSAAAAPAASYYLALGDSLAQGVQPNSTGQSVETNRGYVDDLYAFERARIHGLQLEKLGCPGETTTSMIFGGNPYCAYSGSQIAQAMGFLTTHRVAFVTIDIGANDVDTCGVVQSCVIAKATVAATNLQTILSDLRQAAGPKVKIFGMNYYDPFLALWLQPAPVHALGEESVSLADYFNGLLGSTYSGFSVPVADVARAFQTDNSAPIPFVNLPLNVALICVWTWNCTPPPVGPNVHANDVGYAVIAFTFARKIGGF
jgi:lysophospholipase L1-like esterase